MISSRDIYIETCRTIKKALTDTAEIDAEMDALYTEMEVVAEMIRKSILENAMLPQDQAVYNERYENYVKRHEKAKERYDELQEIRSEKVKKAVAIDQFIETLSTREQLLTDFDIRLWVTTLDKATVKHNGNIAFQFYSGTVIEG